MMNSKSVSVLVVYSVLFLVAMPRGLVGGRGADVLFFGSDNAKVTAFADLEKDSMDQFWSSCRIDFSGFKSVVRALDLLILLCTSDDSTWLLRGDMEETLTCLIPEMKQSIIECLVKLILLPISAEGRPTNMYTMLLPRMLRQYPLSRRHLADQSIHKNSLASAPSPYLALRSHSPIQTPRTETAPASAPVPETNSHLKLKRIAPVPSLPPRKPPLPEGDIKDFSPTPLTDGYIEPEVGHQAPHFHVVLPEKKSNSIQAIIIAVVVTATATLALAAFCFCCCNGYVGRNYQTVNGQKVESPLLSLSLSDFSGSSQKSFGLGNSFHKDKFGSSSFKADTGRSDQVASFGCSAEGYSAASSSNEPTNAHGNPSAPAVPPPPSLKPLPNKTSSPPPAPPPPLPKAKYASPPPPPTGGPPPPKSGMPLLKGNPPPKGPFPPQVSSSSFSVPQPPPNRSAISKDDADGSKAKLKPFFWDKVMAQPDQSMVWHQIKSGSFQFNEEMIETLFGYNAADKRRIDAKMDFGSDSSSHHIQILDPKKSQNLAISLKAQNVKVEEVCAALMEGNELPIELLQTLLRMAPTSDEELKLRLFNDDSVFLGPAEQFLKAIVNIPFAFKRMDALLFMTCLQEESFSVKESFVILEEACKELRNSRLFFKLLEAVLKTGNRMNDGTYRGGAQAFRLDTLLKLSDVKGADGKTTLLHFVVQEIIQSEGRRAVRVARERSSSPTIAITSLNSEDFAEDIPEGSEDLYRNLGLKAVSSLHGELENVKRVAGLDADALTSSVAILGNRLVKVKEFVNTDMRNLEVSGFHDSLKAFIKHAEADITCLLEEEKRIRLLVKNTTDYFHGNAGRDEGLRLFVIVRNFLGILDKACKEVREAPKAVKKTLIHKENQLLQPMREPRQLLFPAMKDRRLYDSSSEDEES